MIQTDDPQRMVLSNRELVARASYHGWLNWGKTPTEAAQLAQERYTGLSNEFWNFLTS